MIYGLTEPIVTTFNKLEDLQDFGTSTQNDYPDTQLIKFLIDIIKTNGVVEHNIRLWNDKVRSDKTWDNFNTHFEEALKNLRTRRGKTMKIILYHYASMLATQVLTEVKEVKEGVLQVMEEQKTDENVSP